MTLQTMGLPRAAPYTDSVEQLGSRVDSIFDELTRELRDVNFSDLNGQVSDSQVPESAVTQHQGAIDHGSIAGLGDDDHPQYGALAQDETVTGSWTFNNTISGDIDGDADTVDGYHGTALAALAENETVSGSWTFSNALVIGSDPGGSEVLRVGDAVRVGTNTNHKLTLTASDDAWNYIRWLDSTGTRRAWIGLNGDLSEFRIALESTTDILRLTGGRVKVGSPTSGEVVNVVHHGTGSPSAVGVDGTIHTQDA